MRSPQSFGLEPERAALAADLIELNMQVHDRAIGMVGPMLPPPDLTMQQFRVLGQVVRRPGISGNELGGLLGVSAPTASGLVERLVEKGLIARIDDADDRRIRRLHPTEAGRDLMRQMDSMFERMLGVVLQVLSADELEVLCQSARTMLVALDRVAERAAGTPSSDY
ncbi:MarR family winged helix-turn-helix transcriptional regulator [Micropruina sp.]|uniref:MarR family winged helix-turn-helix transcriptional regulator n=1 Tax=Micropruina sp. TaxID=2737536 RepID=UPI002630DCB7|nr:MarR family winged helix-turn-helix transcriptional regulator [Micropruina sp.]